MTIRQGGRYARRFSDTEQELNYGRYVAEPNDVQLAAIFILMSGILPSLTSGGEGKPAGNCASAHHRPFSGHLSDDLTRVLPGVQQFVAVQLNIRVRKSLPATQNGLPPSESILPD